MAGEPLTSILASRLAKALGALGGALDGASLRELTAAAEARAAALAGTPAPRDLSDLRKWTEGLPANPRAAELRAGIASLRELSARARAPWPEPDERSFDTPRRLDSRLFEMARDALERPDEEAAAAACELHLAWMDSRAGPTGRQHLMSSADYASRSPWAEPAFAWAERLSAIAWERGAWGPSSPTPPEEAYEACATAGRYAHLALADPGAEDAPSSALRSWRVVASWPWRMDPIPPGQLRWLALKWSADRAWTHGAPAPDADGPEPLSWARVAFERARHNGFHASAEARDELAMELWSLAQRRALDSAPPGTKTEGPSRL